jgi:hypothetical protein
MFKNPTPDKKNGKIDFEFMENFIAELENRANKCRNMLSSNWIKKIIL